MRDPLAELSREIKRVVKQVNIAFDVVQGRFETVGELFQEHEQRIARLEKIERRRRRRR